MAKIRGRFAAYRQIVAHVRAASRSGKRARGGVRRSASAPFQRWVARARRRAVGQPRPRPNRPSGCTRSRQPNRARWRTACGDPASRSRKAQRPGRVGAETIRSGGMTRLGIQKRPLGGGTTVASLTAPRGARTGGRGSAGPPARRPAAARRSRPGSNLPPTYAAGAKPRGWTASTSSRDWFTAGRRAAGKRPAGFSVRGVCERRQLLGHTFDATGTGRTGWLRDAGGLGR